MKISVSYEFLPKQVSSYASVVMDHFGVGFETGRNVIAEDLELPVEGGDIVCFTGESGAGKSSLMRAVAEQLGDQGVVDLDALELGGRILVESLDLPVREALQLLALCGLGEVRLMLRTPAELSDGQRYRFRLALGLARKPDWIVADEFSATLDRTLAKVMAYNVRRIASRTGTGFLLATTHEDILEDLQANLHVRCRLGGEIVWERSEVKKKESVSAGRSGSAMRPEKIGRIAQVKHLIWA